MVEPFATLLGRPRPTEQENNPTHLRGVADDSNEQGSNEFRRAPFLGGVFGNNTLVPLEGVEPPTLSLGRNCSSIELQRLAGTVYRGANVA